MKSIAIFAALVTVAPNHASQDSTPSHGRSNHGAHADLMLEQLKYLGAISRYRLHIEEYSGPSSSETGGSLEPMELVRDFVEYGRDSESDMPLAILRAAVHDTVRAMREAGHRGTWQQDLCVAQSQGKIFQTSLESGGNAAARLVSCDIIYDPDNRQLSILNYQSGITIWDIPHLLAPLPVAPEGLEMFSQSQWIQESVGARVVLHGSPTGSSASMRYIIGPTGDLAGARSTIGHSFKCASHMDVIRHGNGQGEIQSIVGVFASLSAERIHMFAYSISQIEFGPQSETLRVHVPSDATLVDLRSKVRHYALNRESTWPHELQGYIAVDSTESRPQLQPQLNESGESGLAGHWPSIAIGAICAGAVIVCLIAVRGGRAMRG